MAHPRQAAPALGITYMKDKMIAPPWHIDPHPGPAHGPEELTRETFVQFWRAADHEAREAFLSHHPIQGVFAQQWRDYLVVLERWQ